MCSLVHGEDIDEQLFASKDATQHLARQLRSKLISSLEESGAVNSISVCNTEAFKISAELSKKYNGKVSRTSLKIRNPENKPDTWERNTLLEFENQKQAGTDTSQLESYKVIKNDNGKWFRYLKAIPTGDVCLMCHGEHIAPDVEDKIKTLYPNDLATGYEVGDIRGAFTIKLRM